MTTPMPEPMPTPASATRASARLRVLYLTRESHPCSRPDVQVLFGQQLPAQGVQVDLVATGDPAQPWLAGQRHVFAAHGGFGRLMAQARLALAMPRLIGQDVDLVVARDLYWLAAWAYWLARWRGRPFAYWMSLPFPLAWIELRHQFFRLPRGPRAWAQGARWLLKGWISHALLQRVVLPGVRHVFAQSDSMAAYLVGQGLPPQQVTAVPMGVDPALLAALPASRPEVLYGRRWVGYLGALERSRQPDLIVQGFALLRQRTPDVGLLLVGDSQDPADRGWLRDVIAQHGLQSHVLRTGWLRPTEARGHIAGCDLALATYPRGKVHDMASPTKIAEYLAIGVPVLATNHPDQDALLQAVGGGLSVSFTPESLAQGMEQMLANQAHWRAAAAQAAERLTSQRGYPSLAALVAGRLHACIDQQAGAQAAVLREGRRQ